MDNESAIIVGVVMIIVFAVIAAIAKANHVPATPPHCDFCDSTTHRKQFTWTFEDGSPKSACSSCNRSLLAKQRRKRMKDI